MDECKESREATWESVLKELSDLRKAFGVVAETLLVAPGPVNNQMQAATVSDEAVEPPTMGLSSHAGSLMICFRGELRRMRETAGLMHEEAQRLQEQIG